MVPRPIGESGSGRRRAMHQPNGVELATTHLSTGLGVHYAEQGDREGEAIIFLHAYVDSWFSYSRVLPLLSPSYHAFVPDQRGHGDSDKPQCCYTADDYVADVGAFMEVVGIEKANLVGDSSGGLIAQRVALDYPHRVSRLVLIGSPTTLVNNEAVRELGEEMLAGLEDPIPPEFVREFVLGTFHDSVPQGFLERAVSQSLKVPARVWRDYFEGVVLTVDDTARFGEIGAPTLILWGEQDALLPREEQEQRAATIPDATLRVYPETGHLAHWVRPEWVVRDLEVFMRESRPADSHESGRGKTSSKQGGQIGG
jgi:pimeloyl-ACP methyl ester carboxylesterase